jgi:subtilisin family serine protease
LSRAVAPALAVLLALAAGAQPPPRYVRPADPDFRWQWALENVGQTIYRRAQRRGTPDADVDAVEAWAAGYDGRGVVIAMIGKGFAWRDSALAQSLWRNPGEIDGNGIDDDGNGRVDDIIGFDFGELDPDPTFDDDHDRVVAEIALAPHEGRGIAGIAPRARLMLIKIADDGGRMLSGPLPHALRYAFENGADIVAMPWTLRRRNCREPDLAPLVRLLDEYGERVLLVGGAPGEPPACAQGVVGLQATDADDWPRGPGSPHVDFGVPGSDGRTGVFVSNSVGLFAGAAALLQQQGPRLGPRELRQRLEQTADRVHPELAPYFEGQNEFVGFGRLNVARALATDFDGDGLPDADDPDADGDAIPDFRDGCPLDADSACTGSLEAGAGDDR